MPIQRGIAALALSPLLGLALACAAPAAFAQSTVDLAGTFHPGEPGQVAWRVIKPPVWNGTLVLDLDFAPGAYSVDQRTWFLDRGYAIGGIQRTQNETAYELKKYVDDLLAVRQKLIDAGSGTPSRTVAMGASRGAFVSRMAVQYRPDVFVGSLSFAGGGAGVIASWLGKADAVWALKTLVDPSAPLNINNLPDIAPGATYGNDYSQNQALVALVAKARATPQGLARLVLAAAFEQATGWSSGAVQPAPDDYETQATLIADNFAFGNPQFVLKEIEVMAGGPVVWNHGVDYRDLLNRSGDRARVEYWYRKANLDLERDLDALNASPRYSADPAAVQRVEQIGTYTGQTGNAPAFSIKTIGDSADPVSLDEAYERTFAAAGTRQNLRLAFIARAGHSTQNLGERLAAFDVLIERLNTGQWPDTSPNALNSRASTIAAGTSVPQASMGTPQYIPYTLTPALRAWDFTNWGSYFSSYAASLNIQNPRLNQYLDLFRRFHQVGHKLLACAQLRNFSTAVSMESGTSLTAQQAADLNNKASRLGAELGCAR